MAIILAGILLLIYLFSFFITLSSKKRIIRFIQEYSIISDSEIAKKLKRPIESVRNALFSLSKKQKKKKWLIVFLNKRYIFLNENAVETFKELHHRGLNEKQIFESLRKNMNIRSRAEVKAIELTLTSQNRL